MNEMLPMALWCPLYVNDQQIGSFGARRIRHTESGAVYAAEVVIGDMRWHDEIEHDGVHGAVGLLHRIFAHADRARW